MCVSDLANFFLTVAEVSNLMFTVYMACLFGVLLQYNSYMMSTIQQSIQNPSEYQQAGSHGSDSGSSPSRLVGGVHNVEFPQPAFASLRPSSLLCPSRPGRGPSLAGGTYDEGTLEFLSAEMNFSALYMHDIHNWRLNHHQPVQHADDDERARQLWQTDSPPALDTVSVTHRMPNIQEGSEDEEISAAAATAGGRETDHLLSHSSAQTQV